MATSYHWSVSRMYFRVSLFLNVHMTSVIISLQHQNFLLMILLFLCDDTNHIYMSLFQSVCLLHTISQESYIMWSWFFVHTCKMMISPPFFLIFFLILIFQAVRRAEGQKMVQNDKKLCLSHFISQEPSYVHFSSFEKIMFKIFK